MGERPDCQGDLLTGEVEVWVIRHISHEAARREQEVGGNVPATSRAGPPPPPREVPWPEAGNPVFRETVEFHPAGLSADQSALAGPGRRCVRRDEGLCGSTALGLAEKLDAPIPCEAVVGIELQVPVLAAPQLHDLGSRPARSLALAPRHPDHLNMPDLEAGWGRLVVTMLPANTKPKTVRKMRLGQAVFDRWPELRVAIRRDRDEDARYVRAHLTLGSPARWIRSGRARPSRLPPYAFAGTRYLLRHRLCLRRCSMHCVRPLSSHSQPGDLLFLDNQPGAGC